jgi:hypothetical protein
MSRGLQWVLGISAVVVTLVIVLAVVGPWVFPWWFGRGYGSAMMGGYGSGMMGGSYGQGMMGGYGPGTAYGQGMMGGGAPWGGSGGFTSSQRLSIDQARTVAEQYASASNTDLGVAEVMEFENNFYAVLKEASSGRGAMELLIDPFTGSVGPEPGPNMMWNDKYGHMSFGAGGENALSVDEARAFAQQALETQLPGSTVHEDGTSFYGYYTFDFDGADGEIAGMLSVEASAGAVWLHTWHGGFVAEWEAEESGS